MFAADCDAQVRTSVCKAMENALAESPRLQGAMDAFRILLADVEGCMGVELLRTASSILNACPEHPVAVDVLTDLVAQDVPGAKALLYEIRGCEEDRVIQCTAVAAEMHDVVEITAYSVGGEQVTGF